MDPPSTITVTVAGELVIDLAEVPPMALAAIKSALTFANEEREKAASVRAHGWWDLPETVALWRTETRRSGREVLCMPRGFAQAFLAGMQGLGHTVIWDDQRVSVLAAEGYYRPFLLRDYQLDAVLKMLKAEQGFYRAPAGSGKTVTMLGMLAYINQRAIVMVDKAGLLEQWRTRAAQFFGFPMEDVVDEKTGIVTKQAVLTKGAVDAREVGKIGEDVWEERDLTICLRQTLHSRKWGMDATRWWGNWGVWVDDEGHHLAAETTGALAREVVSKFHLATSATPAKSIVRGQIVHAIVGPIIAETSRQELVERGILMQPVVHIERGSFFAEFWDDHDSKPDGVCDKPGCRLKRKHSHRNNYSSVLKGLVEDEERNARIAARIVLDRGHVHLVYSRQLKHLNLIRRELLKTGWPEEKIWHLRGEENAKGLSQEIAQAVEASDEAVILSTVADEGLDIPPIDRVHLVFPMKQEAGVIQVVGRGERIWPGKKGALIIDWAEPLTLCFVRQLGERSRVYRMQGYEIVDPQDEQVPTQEATVQLG